MDLANASDVWSVVASVPRISICSRDLFHTGGAVRFKPDGIMFNSPTAYKAIYQTRANVKKGKFYETWPRNPQYINTL